MPLVMRNGVPTHISVEEYNEQLSKHRNEVLGVDEETGKLRHYTVEDLGKFWINGQEFSGLAYQGLSTVNTKTYVEEPTRANDGSIANINEYDTFVVPRFTANLKYFNIYDYQRLCESITSNEFLVEYYDKQFYDEKTGTLQKVKHKMYAEPEEMAKLYNVGTDVFGVLDYEVSFIGTLNDLDEYTVTYHANGGGIKGNPQPYSPLTTYKKGDRVLLDEDRYFEAIYMVNSFTNEDNTISLTNTTYWQNHLLYEYSTTNSGYLQDSVVYVVVKDETDKEIGRNYYLALKQVPADRPVTDTLYWQKISAKKYNQTTKYSSNKTSEDDTTAIGSFALNDDGTAIYEAIYYVDTFAGHDPTEIAYWKQLALGTGISVKWGNSIVVATPEELFDAPVGYSADYWTTKPDGNGFTYAENQSLNVFRNLDLYAKWELAQP